MTKLQNVLIIGAGGREHALVWKIAQSERIGKLYVAPGNGGTVSIATNVDIAVSDVDGLLSFAMSNDIGLTVVGPDDTLALGVVDTFTRAGQRIFGPTQAAAQIEASKAFSKQLMIKSGVPTAEFKTFTDLGDALDYLDGRRYPLVVKASGLALGKGVVICASPSEARQALQDMMADKIFGAAGSSVVIEDYLTGREVSLHAFCDGQAAVLFPTAQDHKPIRDNDEGPNTGGMGTIAPVPWATADLLTKAKTTVVDPILAALSEAGVPFSGLLYPGLMISDTGFNVLEFNARFGDPETQSYMRLLDTDLLDILDACVNGKLNEVEIRWSTKSAVTIVLASRGYPGAYAKGLPISGIEAASAMSDIVVFHAGTTQKDGQIVTSGGRVLGISATGTDLADALTKAYEAVKLISFEGMQYRTDIGRKSLSHA
jgi:phosphoribosylamine--glycine ligase